AGDNVTNLQVSSGSEVIIARDTSVTDLALDNAVLTLVNASSVTVTTDTTILNNSLVVFDDANGAPDLTVSGLLSATDTVFIGNVALIAARFDITASTFAGNDINITSSSVGGNSSFNNATLTAAFGLDMNIAQNLDLIGGTSINVTDAMDATSCEIVVAGDMTQEDTVYISSVASPVNPGIEPGGVAGSGGGGGGGLGGIGGLGAGLNGGARGGLSGNDFSYREIGSIGGDGSGGAKGGRGGGVVFLNIGGTFFFAGNLSTCGGNGEPGAAGGGGGGSGGYVWVRCNDFVKMGSYFDVGGGRGGSYGTAVGGGGGGGGFIVLTVLTAGGTDTTEASSLPLLGGGWGGQDNDSADLNFGEMGQIQVSSGGNQVTYVRLYGLSAAGYDGGIVVMWHTGVEIDNFGFNVYRSTDPDTGYDRINPAVIVGLGTSSAGGHYAFRDLTAEPATTYYYLVQDVEFDGDSMFHGPVHAIVVPGGSDPVDNPALFVNIGSTDDEGGYNPPEPIPGITPQGGPEIATNVFLVAENADGMFVEIFFPDYTLVQTGAETGDALRVEMIGHQYVSDLGTPDLPVRGIAIDAPEAAAAHMQLLELDYRGQLTISEAELKRPLGKEAFLVDRSLGTGSREVASWKSRRASRGWGDTSPETEYRTFTMVLPDSYFPTEPVSAEMEIRNGRPYMRLSASGARFNPHRRMLEVYERMLVRITFHGPMPQQTNPYPGTEQEVAAAARSIRCFITEPGLYRMTWSEFNASGIDMSFDPRNLKVFIGGDEIAVRVSGESDGSFDPGDEMLFFADAYEDDYAGYNVAFIVPSDGPGKRCATLAAAPTGIPLSGAHWTETLGHQEGYFYNDVVLDVHFYDRWQGYPIMPFPPYSPVTIPFDCPAVASGSHMANFRVVMYSSYDCEFVNPDHYIEFYANGGADLIGTDSWEGRIYRYSEFSFDQSLLSSGINDMVVNMPFPAPAVFDLIYQVRYELAYERGWEPVSDLFIGYTNLTGTHELSGFSSVPVAYDVTDRANPMLIAGGTFAAGDFRFDAVSDRRYAAAAGAGIKTPAWEVNLPSTIGSGSNDYDMLIITHADFRSAAETLADHRRTFSGFSVLVVDVEDVYDEFSFGRKSPEGIRNCVAAAVNDWVSPVQGVLLVGHATPDPKWKFPGMPKDYIPTYFFEIDKGYSASDAPYASVIPDSQMPAVGLGRIPCRSPAEADAVVQKIIDYDLYAPAGAWRKKVILAADNMDDWTGLEDYVALSEGLAGIVTPDYAVQRVYLSNSNWLVTHNNLVAAYNEGAAVLNFSGHGARIQWADEGIFNEGDIKNSSITPPRPQHPFIVVSDCLTGAFDYPLEECMGEAFLARGDSGAIAVFSSAGLTESSGQFLLNQEVFRAIFTGGAETFGDITVSAMKSVLESPGYDPESVKSFILFGDPMQKLVR
ncbi:MAG: C25 family cysteine peptidase, partial [Planctomycetota bacterium]